MKTTSNFLENITLPFYEFFEELKKNNFSLGIAEYKLLIDALSLGYGFDEQGLDYEKSLKLCKTLWLKPNQSAYIFENIFNEKFEPFKFHTQKNEKQNQENEEIKDTKQENISSGETPQENKQQKEKTNLNLDEQKEQEINKNRTQEIKNNNQQQRIKFELGEAGGKTVGLEDKKQEISRRFSFNNYYFEVSKRQMQQISRFLPLTQASTIGDEIDIDKTIEHFAQNGMMAQPIFKKQTQIHNKVHVLIDHEGSMHAFETLSETFAQALQEAFQNTTKHFHKYYFYNVPQKHIFKNTSHTEYKRTAQWIAELKPNRDAVIIISDAGAARDSNSGERFKTTLRFLIQLKKHTSKIAWLNPLPQERWQGNSAERIQKIIPMFYLDNAQELQKTINLLKGK